MKKEFESEDDMTIEQLDFEFEQLKSFSGIEKKSGRLVETKTGLIGRTYNHEDLINGKIRVYVSGSKLLCDPSTLKLKGFID